VLDSTSGTLPWKVKKDDEVSKLSLDLSVLHQLEISKGDPKLEYFIYSISGYCDGPLTSAERLRASSEGASWEPIADL